MAVTKKTLNMWSDHVSNVYIWKEYINESKNILLCIFNLQVDSKEKYMLRKGKETVLCGTDTQEDVSPIIIICLSLVLNLILFPS